MQINYLGNSVFKIKDKKLTLLVGVTSKNISQNQADIIICSDYHSFSYHKRTKAEPFVINSPGEYEISGVSIFGINHVYLIEIAELRFCYVKSLNVNLTDEQIEELNGVDVLLVVMAKDGLNVTQAVRLTKQIQPKIAIPTDSEMVKQFAQELGYEEPRREKKLIISKTTLLEEKEMELITLEERKNG